MLKKLLPLVLVTGSVCSACGGTNGEPAEAIHTHDGGAGGTRAGSSAPTQSAGGSHVAGQGGQGGQAGQGGQGTAGSGGTKGVAPIGSTPTQQLLSELITELDNQATQVTRNASAASVTAVFDLLGTDTSKTSIADLTKTCADKPAPSTTCLGSLPKHTALMPGLNECFQNGCLDTGMSYVDVYITKDTIKDPEPRVTLSYETQRPPEGTITYGKNPLTRWVFDTKADEVKVSADLSATIMMALKDGMNIDLSYSGTIQGQSGANAEYKIELTFPNVMDAPVSVQLNSTQGMKTGSVAKGSMPLATIQNDPLLVWK